MNTLKVLRKSKTLTDSDIKNFELDKLIIINRLNGLLSNKDFCAKNNIKSMELAGRNTSLTRRGHLLKVGEYPVIADKVVEKDDNPYGNSKGKNKEVARIKIANYIYNSGLVGLIPSLPFHTCELEMKILKKQPTQKFIGVEYKPSTYTKLLKTVRINNLKKSIETYSGSFSDKIYGQLEDTYAHIIADYCGGLGKFGKEIEYAIRNKIVKSGGILALTFNKPIRSGKQADSILSLGVMVTNNSKDTRCISDRAFEAYFHKLCGDDYDFLEIFNYKDKKANGNEGSAMVLIVLRRK